MEVVMMVSSATAIDQCWADETKGGSRENLKQSAGGGGGGGGGGARCAPSKSALGNPGKICRLVRFLDLRIVGPMSPSSGHIIDVVPAADHTMLTM